MCDVGVLFLLAIDWVMNKTNAGMRRGIRWDFITSLEDLDLADDISRVPLAGSIRLILLIRAMERDVPVDRIGSSGTSQNGDPIRSNMVDALAMYWRRVSIRITAAVSKCVAKMTQFVMNVKSFYRNQLHSYDFLFSFKSTDIPD